MGGKREKESECPPVPNNTGSGLFLCNTTKEQVYWSGEIGAGLSASLMHGDNVVSVQQGQGEREKIVL